MQCANCSGENSRGSSFCIHCGKALVSDGTGADAPDTPDTQGGSGNLDSRLQSLNLRLSSLEARLANLERRLGVSSTSRAPSPAGTAARDAAVHARPPRRPQRPPTPAQALREETVAVSEAFEPEPSQAVDWEQVIGGNWLARVGVLALILGVAFFLKLAFDNDWIGPTGRVALGAVGGLAMMGAGEFWQKRYPGYARALSGGGVGLLYLSTYAAFAIFDLIDIYPAVVLLLIESVVSAVLALRYESNALAIIGVAGAFCAPFVLGASDLEGRASSSSDGAGYDLIAYVLAVDVGVLVLSTFRRWYWFRLTALLASLASYGIWYIEFGDAAGALGAEIALTCIFLVFVGVTTFFHLIWVRGPRTLDLSLMTFNATAYFAISYALLFNEYRDWMGGFSLAIAVFYLGMAYIALRRSPENARLSLFAFGIGVIFLTIAIPVQLDDMAWTTVGWATQGTVLIWLSFAMKSHAPRFFGYGLFALVAVKLLSFDTLISVSDDDPVLNVRFLAFSMSIAALYLCSFAIWRSADQLTALERRAWSVYPILGQLPYPLDTHRRGTQLLRPAVRDRRLGNLWHPSGLDIFRYNIPSVDCSASLGLTALKLLYEDSWISVLAHDPVLNLRFLAFSVSIAALYLCAFAVWRNDGRLIEYERRAWSVYPILVIAANFLTLWIFTAEVMDFFDQRLVTVGWAIYSALLVWISFMLKSHSIRFFAYGVFALTALKLLYEDTPVEALTHDPVLNLRVLAFSVSIVALSFSAFLIWKSPQRLTTYERDSWAVYPIMIGLANFWTIWILTAEVLDYFNHNIATVRFMEGSRAEIPAMENAQNLSLTVLWAVYALVLLAVGIIGKLRAVRLAGLALLTIPVAKVFVYDVFQLEQAYRVAAFIGLGALLLIGGYLYQRFGRAIREFVTE